RKHSLRSSVQLLAPSLLVVATKFILAKASASFSPSVICIFAVSGAACSSDKRYGIFGPSGLPATHIWPFHLFWKNPLAAVRQTCRYGVPSACRYTYRATTGLHDLRAPLLFLPLPLLLLPSFGGGDPVIVSTACSKFALSRNMTRSIAPPPPLSQPRQLNTPFLTCTANRSSPPQIGQGPTSSLCRSVSLMLRLLRTVSRVTAFALSTQSR